MTARPVASVTLTIYDDRELSARIEIPHEHIITMSRCLSDVADFILDDTETPVGWEDVKLPPGAH